LHNILKNNKRRLNVKSVAVEYFRGRTWFKVIIVEWLVYALLSAFTAALVAIFGKIGLEGVDSIAATGVRAGIMFAAIIVLIIVTGKTGNFATLDSRSLFYIALGGLAGAASWVFYFFALQAGKASQVAPIDRLSVVFVIVLAATILGEKVSLLAAVGTVLVAIGAIIIALAG